MFGRRGKPWLTRRAEDHPQADAEDRGEEGHRSRLVERLVAVAALGRLHAARASAAARTLADRLEGGAQPPLGRTEPPLGDAGAARVAVVDEDRGLAGVLVHRGGDAADVPPVAGGHQGQQPDGGVLGRVDRARESRARPTAARATTAVRDRPPHGAGLEVLGRKRERDLVDHLVGAHQLLDVAGDLVRHPHRPEERVDVAGATPFPDRHHADIGDVPGLGVVVGVGLGDERDPVHQVSSRTRYCSPMWR